MASRVFSRPRPPLSISQKSPIFGQKFARKVMGDNAGVMTDALGWSGTFHGIGARLLRDYSEQIGLDPQFTTVRIPPT
jgi:hypothetical protein